MSKSLKPVRITLQMLPGLRKKAEFPRFAVAEASKADEADVWVAHLHEPILVARCEIRPNEIVLHYSSIERSLVHISDDLIQEMGLYFAREIEGRETAVIRWEYALTTPPPLMVLHEAKTAWTGIISTQQPRFVTEAHGRSILPLDPCDDIGPFLRQAGDFYRKWTE